MHPYTVVGIIVSIAAIFTTILIHVNSSIDKKLEAKLNEPGFIRKVAAQARLPFLVFDEHERYLLDTGASKFIAKINVVKEPGASIKQIVVSPNKLFPIAPVLQSFPGGPEFQEAEKGERYDWVYKTIDRSVWGYDGKPPVRRFRLEIIDIAEGY